MGDEEVKLVCKKFRLTTVVIVLLQSAFIVLFGVFVRYDKIYGLPSKLTSTTSVQTASGITQIPAASSTHTMMSTTGANSNTVEPFNNYTSDLPPQDSSVLPAATRNQVLTAGEEINPNTVDSEIISLQEKNDHVTNFYAMFQDIHVMMFVGFGFLMTFLKKYGFSSVGFNFLVAAFVLQWATLTSGWLLHYHPESHTIYVDIETLMNADFAAATILISFGAVLGKVSSLQLIIMALIEVVAFEVNKKFVLQYLEATDVGDSMVVHTFGAYFGLAVSWVIYRKEVEEAEEKEGSVYNSDLFAMIGTIFLWLFWPSFNGGTAIDEGRLRAVVNTYYALTASTVVSFAISALVHKDKFNMIHVQNSTLAGGVAVGTLADMIIQPWGAILVGSVAGLISVLGFRYLTPLMNKHLKIHDTCGVHNLHGMPGFISGLGSILAAGLATPELYGDGLDKIFAKGRTQGQLAGFQAAALFVSFGMALVCGVITGLILRIPIWNRPNADEIFDDEQSWLIPNDDADESKHRQIFTEQTNGNSYTIQMTQIPSNNV